MKISLFLFCLGFPFLLWGQDDQIVRAEGRSQVEFPDSKSRQQVEKEAEERAVIDALEQAFGRAVIQGNSTYLKNMSTGQKVETTTTFNMIANTMVKGEVIEVVKKHFSEIPGSKEIDGKKTVIRDLACDVTIRARAIAESAVEFDAYPLGCTDPKCKTTDFKNNDPLYLYFKTPVSGYLTIFLDDGTTSQRLLPYASMAGKMEDGVPVEADQLYIFFSSVPGLAPIPGNYTVDEYVMTSESIQDQNRLFVIFSKTPIPKPGMDKTTAGTTLTEQEQKTGWTLPRALPSEDFQKWLIKNRTHNRDIHVKTVDITITR